MYRGLFYKGGKWIPLGEARKMGVLPEARREMKDQGLATQPVQYNADPQPTVKLPKSPEAPVGFHTMPGEWVGDGRQMRMVTQYPQPVPPAMIQTREQMMDFIKAHEAKGQQARDVVARRRTYAATPPRPPKSGRAFSKPAPQPTPEWMQAELQGRLPMQPQEGQSKAMAALPVARLAPPEPSPVVQPVPTTKQVLKPTASVGGVAKSVGDVGKRFWGWLDQQDPGAWGTGLDAKLSEGLGKGRASLSDLFATLRGKK